MSSYKWAMIFIGSRLNWILWIIFIHLIFLGVAYIDYDISLGSIIYLILLNFILSIFFFIFTFVKEIKFYKHLEKNLEPEELKHKSLADTPFQKLMVNYLFYQITKQKRLVTKQQQQISATSASLTDFVHDIKTPVTALNIMLQKEEDPERRKALLFEWSRINEMLDRQLYLTKLESQNNDMYFENVPLKSLIIEEIQLTRNISQSKGIAFEVDFKDDYQVYTDTKWCRMMIRQILSNAIKYSENSSIYVKTFIEDGHVTLNIKDEGRGISAKDLPRIYNKGFTSTRYRNETTSSGIGLYLVKTVKDNLGIAVKIASRENEGTSVTFNFPNQNEIINRLSNPGTR